MDEPAAGVDAACCGVNLASPAFWVRGGFGFFASCDLVPFHGSRPAGWASYSGAEALMISLRLRHDQGRALIQKRIFPQAVKLVP
jgi:hypothetical protein